MAARYNFKIQKGNLTFGVDGADSFDEAIKKVERGVYDYELKNGKIKDVENVEIKNEQNEPIVVTVTPPVLPPADSTGNADAGKKPESTASVNQ